ncbi:serine/threonine-protein kinase [Streptomyces sp. NPDC004134]|uniref:serine/threonine-protein kinase n=1 Tax=Streptomyces sp. NPDC004134 TaxID=3364691 RepID=UPI00367CE217
MSAGEGAGPGDRFGPYEVLRLLGRGGMGEVFLARSPAGRPVAVKTLLSETAPLGAAERARFAREIALARRAGGPHTAAVIDADPEAAVPWMATEYVAAPSLGELVRDCGLLTGPAAVGWVGAGVAEALLALHAVGVVHRDVKPSNVLLPPAGPKVVDFGIAHAADLTRTQVTLGTIAFTSPEQARGEPSTAASDVYALGATLFHLATGHPPYPASEPLQLLVRVAEARVELAGLPPQLDDLIRPCLRLAPADRPAVRELLRDLTARVADTPGAVGGAGLLPGEWRERIAAYERTGAAAAAEAETAPALADARPAEPAGQGGQGERADQIEPAGPGERAESAGPAGGSGPGAPAAAVTGTGTLPLRADAPEPGPGPGGPGAATTAPAPVRTGRRAATAPLLPSRGPARLAAFTVLLCLGVIVALLIDRLPGDAPEARGSAPPASPAAGTPAAQDPTPPPTPTPAPTPPKDEIAGVEKGDCLSISQPADRNLAMWDPWSGVEELDPVPCGSAKAYMKVTSLRWSETFADPVCPRSEARDEFSVDYDPGDGSYSDAAVAVCVARQFRAGQCFPGLYAPDNPSDSAASLLSVTRCSKTEIPEIDNRMYRITGVEPLAEPQSCPPGSDSYWAFEERGFALCAGML